MPLLHLDGVTKRFGGLIAVNTLGFDVNEGEILGLIGPNGAGKTTVFNLITGIYRPGAGAIDFEQKSLIGLAPHSVAERGIARTFQNNRVFQNLSVLENVMAGQHCRTKAGVLAAILRTKAQQQEEEAIRAESLAALRTLGLDDRLGELAHNLPYGAQKRLEIARALAVKPRLLILDEPAGGLNDTETAELREMIVKIRDGGVTVLLIEHDMSVVMNISDRVVVIEQGEKISQGTPAEVQADPRVIEAYLGREEEATA